MGEMSCPQCGNPNLDVDAENNVVFCRRCGFAVQVDPQTGEVTPLQQGGAQAQAPPVYRSRTIPIVGTDSFTFFMGATAVLLLLVVLGVFKDLTWYIALQAAVAVVWYLYR